LHFPSYFDALVSFTFNIGHLHVSSNSYPYEFLLQSIDVGSKGSKKAAAFYNAKLSNSGESEKFLRIFCTRKCIFQNKKIQDRAARIVEFNDGMRKLWT